MIKQIGMVVIAGFFSLSVYADAAKTESESFQNICTNAWMKGASEAKDQVDYKNFGEKYCDCAAKQPLDSEAAIQKAIQLCMSQTLLNDAMDSLEEDLGVSAIKDTDIADYCQDRWNLIYPKQSDADKSKTMAYCECAKPKLMDLVKSAESMTDKQYKEEVDKVAAVCSGDALAIKPTAN